MDGQAAPALGCKWEAGLVSDHEGYQARGSAGADAHSERDGQRDLHEAE
jgi:hypothetical protein